MPLSNNPRVNVMKSHLRTFKTNGRIVTICALDGNRYRGTIDDVGNETVRISEEGYEVLIALEFITAIQAMK